MIKNIQKVRNMCEEVNNLTNCNVKTGMQHTDKHISIYDTNNYDDMFGFQVLSQLTIDDDQLENDCYSDQLKEDLIKKVCNITGISL